MGAGARALVYSASLATYIYGIYYFALHVRGHSKREANSTFAGEWKYLTILNMWLQTMYYAAALLCELLTAASLKVSSFRSAIDRAHASAAWPFGVFVDISFWTLYTVDRELVYPKALDEFIPVWLNHVMHSVHVPLLLADKYVTQHNYPQQLAGVSVTIGLSAFYQLWLLYLALAKGIWVYPILKIMPWSIKIPSFILLWLVMWALYKTGNRVTVQFWGSNKLDDLDRRRAKLS